MKRERREVLALLLLGLILLGPALALAYQYWLRPSSSDHRVIAIRATIAERGGFQPDAPRVALGETVTLRFSSTDVTHGIAIGPGLGVDLGHVDPGRVREITLTFDRAGTYTYYCNAWCSPDHWRMRGTIEVVDPANPGLVVTPQPDPVIAALIAEGVDIDAGLHADEAGHVDPPPQAHSASAERGAEVIAALEVPAELHDPAWRRAHTPLEAAERLGDLNPSAARQDLLDAAAYLWRPGAAGDRLSQTETLYNKNCAACHGQYGGGDGPAAPTSAEAPTAFADSGYMLERRGDVLYAKIRRGGMGTGMPNFGTVFTPDETWALVEYLWTLAFDESAP